VTTAAEPRPSLPAAATTGNQVPFIRLDAADPELFAELLAVVERVAGDAAFTLGPELEGFEQRFASYCDARHGIGVSSGTAALELVLRGLGIGPGDEVIVPTYSFIASAEAVTAVRAWSTSIPIPPCSPPRGSRRR
jgi:dTDP-3-amino-3,4,6-trideoxy-alpha-D-glucose transaminase